MAAGVTYTARITTGVTDAAGAPMAADKVWSFTVAGAAPTDPTVVSTIPTNGATGVSASANVQATFSEAMNPSSVTASTFTLVQTSSGTHVPATVTIALANVATLNPNADLTAGVTYTATISTARRGRSGQ